MIASTPKSMRIVFLISALTFGSGLVASAKKAPRQGTNKAQSSGAIGLSFRKDVMPELVRSCTAAAGCHGNKATESVNLDLRMDAAYAQLVDNPSQVRKGAMRVKRGDPEASFLVNKLEGNLNSGEGKRMPLDDQSGMPIVPSPISGDYVEKVLKPWILAGAPDN